MMVIGSKKSTISSKASFGCSHVARHWLKRTTTLFTLFNISVVLLSLSGEAYESYENISTTSTLTGGLLLYL